MRFTDLIRFHDRWFCVFRESDTHAGSLDGTIRVLTSEDGRAWSSAASVAEPGVDLRDPKLSITPDGRLMLSLGGSVYEGTKLRSRRPRVSFSEDGRTWSPPLPILADGHWLWRVTWHDGRAYGVSYLNSGSQAFLYTSKDGIHYDEITEWHVPGAGESTLRFLPDGTMIALVRREAENRHGWIGTSHAPFTDWEWHEIDHRLGGPNFIADPAGHLWAGSREHTAKGTVTVIARMDPQGAYEPVVTLPSGGDTSYPGLVWHEGELWVSYYSSHEGKTRIYLARVTLPEPR